MTNNHLAVDTSSYEVIDDGTPCACPVCYAEFTHRDTGVLTELKASIYPYGGGRDDRGVQITLTRDIPSTYGKSGDGVIRLPHPRAVALARWILDQYGEVH